MSVTVQAAVKANPSPCKHYVITINRDGVQQEVIELSAADIATPLTSEELQEALEGVVKLWLRYHRGLGADLSDPANIVGKVIFNDVL